MLLKKQINLILLLLLLVLLIANGYLYFFIKNLQKDLEQKKVELEYANNDINAIRSYAEQDNSPEKQLERMVDQVKTLQDKILDLEGSQYRELKWLKYSNKDLGISFEYPNLWGDTPVVTTSVAENIDLAGNLELSEEERKMSTSSLANKLVMIKLRGVQIEMREYTKNNYYYLHCYETCRVNNVFDSQKRIALNTNLMIDGYKAMVHSSINPGGNIDRQYWVVTNRYEVDIYSDFTRYSDYLANKGYTLHNNINTYDILHKFINENPNDAISKDIQHDLEISDKFIKSIKFSK